MITGPLADVQPTSLARMPGWDALLSQIVTQAGDGIAVFHVDDVIVYANPALAALFNCSVEQLIGRHLNTFIEVTPETKSDQAQADATGEPFRAVVDTHRADGRRMDVWVSVTPLLDSDGVLVGRIASAREVTEYKHYREQLEREALHDPLTDLPNRRLLTDRLKHALARAERTETPVALLFVDLDGFKSVNDTYGHETGDRLLREVATRFKASLRNADTLARLGGDEFVVLVEEVTEVADPTTTADRLLSCLSAPFHLNGESVRVSASIGIATSCSEHPRDLLHAADSAMYEAKNSGQSQVVTRVSIDQLAEPLRASPELS